MESSGDAEPRINYHFALIIRETVLALEGLVWNTPSSPLGTILKPGGGGGTSCTKSHRPMQTETNPSDHSSSPSNCGSTTICPALLIKPNFRFFAILKRGMSFFAGLD